MNQLRERLITRLTGIASIEVNRARRLNRYVGRSVFTYHGPDVREGFHRHGVTYSLYWVVIDVYFNATAVPARLV